MAKISYLVRSKKKGQPATMYLRLAGSQGLDLWTPTEVQILPEYWSNKTQSFKQRILFTEEFTEKHKIEIEGKLADMKTHVSNELLKETNRLPSKQWLKSTVASFFGHTTSDKKPSKKETLNQYIDRFVREATSGQRLCFVGSTKRRYAPESQRNLRDFKHIFNLYQGIYDEPKQKNKRLPEETEKRKYKPLHWPNITIDFYNEFVQFFYDRNCSGNYVGKHLKTLKTILRQAREEGYPVNDDVEKKAFKVIVEDTDAIYLTEEEVRKLYLLDLSDNKVFQVARDVFLCGVYTAQRYSDYSRIKKNDIKVIDGKKYLNIRQQKTGERCIIPIRPELDAILSRYDYTLPKTWEQKINMNIKKVAAKAEIKEKVEITQYKGGMKVTTTLLKSELVKTHTARRTGCTLMYLSGIPVIDIMKTSGHKTESEFLKYIRVGKQETATNLSSHKWFLGNTLSVAN